LCGKHHTDIDRQYLTSVRGIWYSGANRTKGNEMDEFEFFMDEDEYAIEEEYEFEQFIDHDSGYEQDEQSYYAEAMLAYYD
jgi:hypothetical protein